MEETDFQSTTVIPRVGILLKCLTPPHICVSPNPDMKYQGLMSWVFYYHFVNVRGKDKRTNNDLKYIAHKTKDRKKQSPK